MSEEWLNQEVCCGFLWYQFKDFSNHVKFCPSCGMKVFENLIPKEALE